MNNYVEDRITWRCIMSVMHAAHSNCAFHPTALSSGETFWRWVSQARRSNAYRPSLEKLVYIRNRLAVSLLAVSITWHGGYYETIISINLLLVWYTTSREYKRHYQTRRCMRNMHVHASVVTTSLRPPPKGWNWLPVIQTRPIKNRHSRLSGTIGRLSSASLYLSVRLHWFLSEPGFRPNRREIVQSEIEILYSLDQGFALVQLAARGVENLEWCTWNEILHMFFFNLKEHM